MLSRRAVSVGLAASALVRCAGRVVGTSQASRFPFGVASGDPSPDGIALWTRYTGTAPLSVVVWPATADESSPAIELAVTPDSGGFAIAEVTGLEPWSTYQFAFLEGEQTRSPIGRFKTAPALAAQPTVRLGATCCTCYGNSFAALSAAAQRDDLDAFLLLGDTVYADGADTLEQFRGKWATTFSEPEYQQLKASTALIATWDDHEFNNDWSGDSISPARFQAGSTAWFEHVPMRRNRQVPGRVWRSVRYGKTLEVFVLDCRSERVRSKGQYISPEQLAWLETGLANSECTFKAIMNSVPISQFAVPFFAPELHDRWEGFPEQRRALLQFIDDAAVSGVLWVSGDFHLACAGRVSTTGPGQRAVEVLVGPGGQVPNGSPSYPSAPQFDWSSGINNYTELLFDPTSGQATVSWLDAHGRTLYSSAYSLG